MDDCEPRVMLKIAKAIKSLPVEAQERVAVWTRRTFGPKDRTGAERAHRYRDSHSVTVPLRNGVTSRDEDPPTVTVQERDESTKRTKVLSTSGSYLASPGFCSFWLLYPKRVGKGEAFKSWTKGNCEVISEVIVKAVREQTAYLEREGGKFIPLPATWLNQKRWEDEPPTAATLHPKTAANLEVGRKFLQRGQTP